MPGSLSAVITALAMLGWFGVHSKDAEVVPKEYCFQESFNVTCPHNHVIIMQYALYGRMRFGRCMKEDHGHTGCFADVLPALDQKCSGLNHCKVDIPPAGVSAPQCPKELMKYLEADYKCQAVEPSHQCTRHKNSALHASNITRFLLPPETIPNFRGTRKCPWVISTEAGRQINLTIMNFDILSQERGQKSGSHYQDHVNCNMVAVIKDHNKTVQKPVCKDSRRESLFYLSLSHSVEVYIMSRTITGQYNRFLISYTAIGCPDMRDMPYAWINRQGDTLVVKCNYTGETFFLSCTGTRWIGELHNCTGGPNFTPHHNGRSTRFPYGLLIVIGIGVALGVALGIILLAGILTCFRRRKEHQMTLSRHTSDPLLSEVTRETDIDNSSNYYERRFQALATIGRSPRISREAVYNDRSLSHMSNVSQQRFCTLPGGSRTPGTYRQMSGIVNIPKRAVSESPYCSCVQPASPPNPATQQNSSSFVTFKPSADCPPSQSAGNSPSHSSPTIVLGRSLDLLRDSGHKSPDLLKDSDITKIQNTEPTDTSCSCPPQSKHAPINNNNSISRNQYPNTTYACDSSNNKSI